MRIFRRPQGNEIDRASESIAAVGIFGSEPFRNVDCGERGNRKARKVEVAGIPVVEQLPVERH